MLGCILRPSLATTMRSSPSVVVVASSVLGHSPFSTNAPAVSPSETGVTTRVYATGRRKTSSARVFLTHPGTGIFKVNKKQLIEEIKLKSDIDEVLKPFQVTGTYGKFDIWSTVKGGGTTGRTGALRHGISRCLEQFDKEQYRVPLKRAGLLTRDPRMVERKKPGKPKARKSRQWVKR